MPGEVEQQTIGFAVRAPMTLHYSSQMIMGLIRASARLVGLALKGIGGGVKMGINAVDKLSKSDPISAKKKIRDLHLDEMEDVESKDVRALRREFNRNHVNFAMKRSPEKGYYTVFYGANDVNRAEKAFEKVLGKTVEKPRHPPMKERLAAAVKESERREAARAVEKVAERAVKAPAREAR